MWPDLNLGQPVRCVEKRLTNTPAGKPEKIQGIQERKKTKNGASVHTGLEEAKQVARRNHEANERFRRARKGGRSKYSSLAAKGRPSGVESEGAGPTANFLKGLVLSSDSFALKTLASVPDLAPWRMVAKVL